MSIFNSNPSDSGHTKNNSHRAQETTRETSKNSRLALYLAFLALFFTALGITVGYKHWLRIHEKAKQSLVEISQIKDQLSQTANSDVVKQLQLNINQSSNDAEQRLTDALHELDLIREQTTYSAKTVKDQIRELTHQQTTSAPINGAIKQGFFSEARFLLEAAQHQLIYNHNKLGALRLLETADQLLIRANATNLIIVREKLAHDIAQLKLFPSPDIDELIQSIYQLGKKITPLSDSGSTAGSASQPVSTFGVSPESPPHQVIPQNQKTTLFKVDDKTSFSGRIKDYLNHSITIRKQAVPPLYALNNMDKQRADQLIKLRLESLLLMLLQHRDSAYHQQINHIKEMLQLYYPATLNKDWLATLDKMNQQNINPTYPDISSALTTLINLNLSAKPTEKCQ